MLIKLLDYEDFETLKALCFHIHFLDEAIDGAENFPYHTFHSVLSFDSSTELVFISI